MSRYEKPISEGKETFAVGWDVPMNTFFAQVRVNQADDDLRYLPLSLWLGGNFNDFIDVEAFAMVLASQGYALEPNIKAQLKRDQFGALNHDASLLQKEGWTARF